jgi:hypothetical protein
MHAEKLWKGALEILDSDSQERHQELAKDLVNEKFHGPEWITFTSKTSTCADNTQLICVEKFLRVLTHPSIKPLSIDPFVGTMYLLLGGTNGEQGMALLSNMCQKLLRVTEELSQAPGDKIQGMVDAILKALLELLSKT